MNIPQKTLSLLAIASLFTLSSLSAVETDPVGYVTETIKPASFNLIGINLSSPVASTGVFESAAGNTLTDDQADFTTSLDSGSDYVLKITNGGSELGMNTGVTASSGTTVTTDDDISSVVTATTQYEIRKVLTVADIFGASNDIELQGASAGDTSSSDVIWIPDGNGGYTQVYYNSVARGFPPLTVGWKTTLTGNSDASSTPLYFTSGLFIQVQRSAFGASEAGVDPGDLTSKDIVISGSVIVNNSQVAIETGFNAVSRVFPGDLTLADTAFDTELASAVAGNTTDADIIWAPDGSGGYTQYYYNGVARGFPPLSVGWKGTLTGNTDVSTSSLTTGFFIQRKGAAGMATLTLPSGLEL